MKYISSKEASTKWNISERSVRNYCQSGRVPGAFLNGKTWMIPFDSIKPKREIRHFNKKETLLEILKREKECNLKGGIYHKLQIEFTYNSNHMEGSKLSADETRYIFETNTIGKNKNSIEIDDIIETVNHFRCIDLVIDLAKTKLNESIIKQLHYCLKTNTSDSTKNWFKVGDYKMIENEVGGSPTTPVNDVKKEIDKLLKWYNSLEKIDIENIIDFHYRFEKIHPFQDGNGRVGRLIMLKECLKNDIVPILIKDEYKELYYRGLSVFSEEKGCLMDTCLFGQDILKEYLKYFKITL